MTASGYLTIDTTEYAIPIVSCKRTLDSLDRFAERTQDGILHRQLIGNYVNYQVTFARPHTMAQVVTYAALWLKLAEPTEWHDFIMPDGFAFNGYVGTGASDDIRRILSATVFWESLAVNFIARAPAYVP